MKKQLICDTRYLQNQFDRLSNLIEEYLPRKKGQVPEKDKLTAILEAHQGLLTVDACVFGIIDYSNFKYIFLSENVSRFDLDRQRAIEEGLPYVASAFHPSEVPVIFEKVLPSVIEFLGKSNTALHLKRARTAFTSRIRLRSGEYKWHMHQMSVIYSDENNLPLLGLKSIFEIDGVKRGDCLDLILTLRGEADHPETVKEHVFSTAAPSYNLSPREIEILQLISAGKASKEIAHLLNLSIHTVNNHRKSIMRKKSSASMSAVVFNAATQRVL